MRKVLIFKKGLIENIIENGFVFLKKKDIQDILICTLGKKIKKISLKELLDQGLEKRDSLLIACAYELGKRKE